MAPARSCRSTSSPSTAASASRSSGPTARGRRRCCGSWPPSSHRPSAACASAARTRRPCPPGNGSGCAGTSATSRSTPRSWVAPRSPVTSSCRSRGARWGGRSGASAPWAPSMRSASRTWPVDGPPPSPVARRNVSAWRGRWSRGPASCCSTSPPRRWTSRPGPGSWPMSSSRCATGEPRWSTCPTGPRRRCGWPTGWRCSSTGRCGRSRRPAPSCANPARWSSRSWWGTRTCWTRWWTSGATYGWGAPSCCAAVPALPGLLFSRRGPAGCGSVRTTPGDGSFRVTEVGPGPGHWRVELRGAAPLTAHVPWDRPPPAVGDEVTVTVRPSAAALVRRPSCAG